METRTWIEVDVEKIRRNILKVKNLTGKKILASVKCNLYGMGIENVAEKIDDLVDFYGVACLDEALELKKLNLKKPILIMGSILPENVEQCILNNIRITLCNDEIFQKIKKVSTKFQKKAIVHIKVDTGLGRIGFREKEIIPFIEKIIKFKGIEIEGLFSHFATSESKDKTYAKYQLNTFKKIVNKVENLVKIPIKHIANSGGVLNLPESYQNFDMVRVGLLLLGVYPAKYLANKVKFDCAIKGFTRIAFIKNVEKSTPLSYGLSFITKRKTKVATCNIGYGDGLRRDLSNKFWLKLNGKKVKIIGNICMDQTLIDVTGKNVKIGDIIEIFGDNFEIETMAEICNTVPQEILCGFGSKRVKKIYIYGR
ncbi:MAG: alanine racemase [Candidatus Omnitrophica bacterium]|nr:alanine racemase [Candidatus Omnitrophota bacterium]MCM8801856.1 alanine racemase [Candidatus Omnitrophota bacterium]